MTVAVLGGSVGSLLGMYTVRHKTKHPKFTIGIPLLLAAINQALAELDADGTLTELSVKYFGTDISKMSWPLQKITGSSPFRTAPGSFSPNGQ